MIILTLEHISSLEEKVNALSNMVKTAITGQVMPIAYSNKELLKLLNVSSRTLQSWRDAGKITHSKVGHRIFYRREDVENFLLTHSNALFFSASEKRQNKSTQFKFQKQQHEQ